MNRLIRQKTERAIVPTHGTWSGSGCGSNRRIRPIFVASRHVRQLKKAASQKRTNGSAGVEPRALIPSAVPRWNAKRNGG